MVDPFHHRSAVHFTAKIDVVGLGEEAQGDALVLVDDGWTGRGHEKTRRVKVVECFEFSSGSALDRAQG